MLPVLRRERAAGRMPTGATRALAGWVCHLRGLGAPINDAGADAVLPLAAGPLSRAVRGALEFLDPALAGDDALVTVVLSQAEELERTGAA